MVLTCAPVLPAAGRVAVMRPTVTECSNGKSWNDVRDCLDQAGFAFTIASKDAYGQVLLVKNEGEHFVALYVHQPDHSWSLGGELELGGDADLDIIDFKQIKVGGIPGFRIDVGVRSAINTPVDPDTVVEGVLFERHALFCNGKSSHCTDVIPTCDRVVGGLGMSSFHGEIQLTDREIQVVGDGRLAEPGCTGPVTKPLRWQR